MLILRISKIQFWEMNSNQVNTITLVYKNVYYLEDKLVVLLMLLSQNLAAWLIPDVILNNVIDIAESVFER